MYTSPFAESIFTTQPQIYSETFADGARAYRIMDAQPWWCPSVTTVLGRKISDGLKRWEARIGKEEAEKIRNSAAKRGEILHTLTEQYYLKTQTPPKLLPNQLAFWVRLRPLLNKLTLVASEHTVVHKKLKVAGRFDFIFREEATGRLVLVDLKTQKTASIDMNPDAARERDDKYLLQLSVYWDVLSSMGFDIHEAAIYAIQDGPWSPIVLTRDRQAGYLHTFAQLVDEYYKSPAWTALVDKIRQKG